MITPDLLRRISLFECVPESELQTIAARAADVRLAQDEWLLLEGQAPSFFGILEGRMDLYKWAGRQNRKLISYEQGEYFGEVPLLLGAPSLASVRASEPSRVVRLEGSDFIQLISQCSILNEEVSKTMVTRVHRLRHVAVEQPADTAKITGYGLDTHCYALRDFLSLSRIPFFWDETDAPGPTVVELPGKEPLVSPTVRELARALGFGTEPKKSAYDVVIVGGGPSGLAAAVYGASEGLCTLLVERSACGGQAGTSSRIENYLGFPAGLSGEELAGRAYDQAERLGAELVVARQVVRIEPGVPGAGEATEHTLVFDDDTRVTTCAVVLATGVAWRRLEVPGIERLEGHGVFYGAARGEAMRFQGKRIHLVGGGNSAGQAALLFSGYAAEVTMLVRGPALAESMSQYLIDQLGRKANVKVETNVEVVGVEGADTLTAIEVVCGPERKRERRESGGVFVFIGAGAETDWLPAELIRDQWGYICTGRDVLDLLSERRAEQWPLERDPFLLETSVPGVLAAGDVRHGSIKRCAAGVGEGSMSIAVVHRYLAESHAHSIAGAPS